MPVTHLEQQITPTPTTMLRTTTCGTSPNIQTRVCKVYTSTDQTTMNIRSVFSICYSNNYHVAKLEQIASVTMVNQNVPGSSVYNAHREERRKPKHSTDVLCFPVGCFALRVHFYVIVPLVSLLWTFRKIVRS